MCGGGGRACVGGLGVRVGVGVRVCGGGGACVILAGYKCVDPRLPVISIFVTPVSHYWQHSLTNLSGQPVPALASWLCPCIYEVRWFYHPFLGCLCLLAQ